MPVGPARRAAVSIRSVGFRDWLVRRLGGDALVGDPDGIVEVGLVELWQSELVRSALREAGIAAETVHEASAHTGGPQHIRPMSRVLAARRDYRRAVEVVTRVQHGDPSGDVAWPPRHETPWAPPAANRAQP